MGAKATSDTEDEFQMSAYSSYNSRTLMNGADTSVSTRLLESDDSHDHYEFNEQTQDSDLETATNSSDEFDWDAEEEITSSRGVLEISQKARRGRRIWNIFMRLARPIRTAIAGLIGAGLFITPLLVFRFRFRDNAAYKHVFAWSLWLSVTWAAGCVTYTLVDFIPDIVVRAVRLFHGRFEILQSQMEVRLLYVLLVTLINLLTNYT